MNRRRPKRWLSLWLIVAMLGHFGLYARDASAFVVCFGSDGHVAVETAGHHHRSEAGPELRKAPLSEVAASTTQARGTSCIDIPVVSEDHGAHKPLIESRGQSPDCKVLVSAALIIALLPCEEAAAQPIFFPDAPVVDPRLPTLRSVLLLI
ncbi:MAG: hypothetical protein ACREYF_22835 [Gammaproteobacteria bacterium]